MDEEQEEEGKHCGRKFGIHDNQSEKPSCPRDPLEFKNPQTVSNPSVPRVTKAKRCTRQAPTPSSHCRDLASSRLDLRQLFGGLGRLCTYHLRSIHSVWPSMDDARSYAALTLSASMTFRDYAPLGWGRFMSLQT